MKQTFENILKDLNGRRATIKLNDAHEHLQSYGISQAGLDALLQEIEEIPTDRMDAQRKARFTTFFKGFKKEAPLDDTKAALVSLRFLTIFPFKRRSTSTLNVTIPILLSLGLFVRVYLIVDWTERNKKRRFPNGAILHKNFKLRISKSNKIQSYSIDFMITSYFILNTISICIGPMRFPITKCGRVDSFYSIHHRTYADRHQHCSKN